MVARTLLRMKEVRFNKTHLLQHINSLLGLFNCYTVMYETVVKKIHNLICTTIQKHFYNVKTISYQI